MNIKIIKYVKSLVFVFFGTIATSAMASQPPADVQDAQMTITNKAGTPLQLQFGTDCARVEGPTSLPVDSKVVENIYIDRGCGDTNKFVVIDFFDINGGHVGGYRYEDDFSGLYVYEHPFKDCWYMSNVPFDTAPANGELAWGNYPYQLAIGISYNHTGTITPTLQYCPKW